MKSYNKSLLIYQLVCHAKYRREVFTEEVEETLKNICIEIEKRYEIHFIEIGADNDHIRFLIQSIPSFSPTKIANTLELRNAKIYSLAPQKHLKDREILRPEDLNFCVS